MELGLDTRFYSNTLDELSKFIFTTKYARYLEDKQRRETWEEAVGRVESMHLRKFSELSDEHVAEIKWAFDKVRNKQVMPSMRSMQFGGKAIEAKNERIYNCAVRHLDSVRAFSELFYLLLCGCGTGIGLTHKYFDRLPDLVQTEGGETLDYVIEDTIEGWADSCFVLLSSYFVGNEYSGKRINFIYDRIRLAGSKLNTSGGKAPGPDGLRNAHENVRKVMDRAVMFGDRLVTIDGYDVLMHYADAVLSGGVRRSATSVMFDKDDVDMLNAKTGEWYITQPQRKRSNNSVMLMRNELTFDEFVEIYERTKEWGEPGYVFCDDEDTIYNPCFEIGMIPISDEGVSGVQFCNLSSINGGKVETAEDFYEFAKAATIIGTLQASYTSFPYLSREAEDITKAEALLGVSITGMFENTDVLLSEDVLRKGSQIVSDTNRAWAEIVGINPAARLCALKPEGTGSKAVGTPCNGAHPAHAKFYWQRVQMNRMDNVYQFIKAYNPQLCEPSVHSANDTDDVIRFPIHASKASVFKSDLTALEHLNIIKRIQENWVLPGTSEFNKKNVHHNVSCTIIVDSDEWKDVCSYLYENRYNFSAVSLLAKSGDKDYQQAPFEAVSTLEDVHTFHSDMMSFIPVDYSQMIESEDGTTLMQEAACVGGACEI